MNKLFTLLLTLFATTAFGQISMEDSTAQVISYWSIGEKQSYSMSFQTIKLQGEDTTENVLMTYDVDITVIDSTENSYLVEWFYKNYKTNSTSEIVKKITALSEDIKVIIETDEFGVMKGVENWKEVSEYMEKSIQPLKDEFQDAPQLEQLFKKLENMYLTKEGIEATAIQDAQQFHTFHGGRYFLGEVLEFPLPVSNMYDQNKPLDSKVTLSLDELNPEDNNFIIRSSQEIDSGQLTEVTYNYLKSLSESMKIPAPTKEDIGQMTNVISTASMLHETGWLIYSIQTKRVEAQGTIHIEERIIEIK
ncbi:hypothetical protein QWY85_17035 [Neolewinella lacunae]|uniref:Uncharacterized protein n=1 Tax=Neolewinella lacunae TaxID=1517758 RepID=A0A923PM26_9BACT|nr:hypothetical protein [Neolewinella lacunae]MBC6993678.1 hypothetical protein [Neolewinella lacunae]MDN3636373.1 hypothetical protein [Neolewinella lacunae]